MKNSKAKSQAIAAGNQCWPNGSGIKQQRKKCHVPAPITYDGEKQKNSKKKVSDSIILSIKQASTKKLLLLKKLPI